MESIRKGLSNFFLGSHLDEKRENGGAAEEKERCNEDRSLRRDSPQNHKREKLAGAVAGPNETEELTLVFFTRVVGEDRLIGGVNPRFGEGGDGQIGPEFRYFFSSAEKKEPERGGQKRPEEDSFRFPAMEDPGGANNSTQGKAEARVAVEKADLRLSEVEADDEKVGKRNREQVPAKKIEEKEKEKAFFPSERKDVPHAV